MFAIIDGRQRALVGVDIAFTILPTLMVLVRVYCRIKVKHTLTATDYCLFAALVFDWAITAAGFVIVYNGGVGLHQSSLEYNEIVSYLKTLYSIELLWAGAEGLLKTSMCLFFIEIFQNRRFRIVSYCVIAVCNAFALTVVLSTTFICNPVALSWDPTIPGVCGNRNALWLAIGLLNIFTDVLVLVLPVPQVWKLQISTRQKLGVCSIFGLGFFVCIVSIIRLKFLLSVDFYGDTSYTVADAIIWSTLEPTTGVIVACLPTFGYFLRKWMANSSSKELSDYLRQSERPGYGRASKVPTRRKSNDTVTAGYPLVTVAVTTGAGDDVSEPATELDTRDHSTNGSVVAGQISVKQEWHVSHS